MTTWSDVSFTLDGVPFPAESVSIERTPAGERRELPSVSYEASFTVDLEPGAFEALVDALTPKEPAGASIGTLAKRVFYGGRKGRGALRRILARGYDAVAMSAAGPMLFPRGFLGSRAPLTCAGRRTSRRSRTGAGAGANIGGGQNGRCMEAG